MGAGREGGGRRDRATLIATGLVLGLLWLVWAIVLPALPAQAQNIDKVRIAIGQDFSPFEFVDDEGKATGLVADTWRLWSQKTGIEIEFIPLPWAETLEAVRDGRADLHAGLNKSTERDAYLDFSRSIFATNVALFFPTGLGFSHKTNQLAGFEVGVLEGSFEEGLIRERFPKAKVVAFAAVDALYDAVDAGQIALFADVIQTAFYNLSKRGISDDYAFNGTELLDTNYLYAAVSEGNDRLLEVVQAGLNQISAVERTEISQRWLGKDISTDGEGLVVVLYNQYPPMSLVDATGEPAGMLVDMWKLWAEKTGQKITFKLADWPETLTSLRNGTADIHFGLFHSDERAQWIGFSKPYYSSSSSFYKLSERPTIPPQSDLAGVRLGVVAGYLQEAYLRETFPRAEIVPLHDDGALLSNLLEEEIDLFFSEDPTIQDLLLKSGLQGRIESMGAPLIRNGLYAGVRKERSELLALVDRGLDAITDAEWQRLEARWIKDPSKRYFGKTTSDRLGLTEAEKTWIRENPVVRAIGLADWPPLDFVTGDGSHTGITHDIAQLAAERAGLELRFEVGPWPEQLEKLKRGEIDLAPEIYWTEDRAEQLAYTKPYLPLHDVIFTRPAVANVTSATDLSGKTVAVERGYAIQELLEADHPDVELLVVESTLDALKSVSIGTADAYVGSQYVGSYLIEQNLLSGIEAVAQFNDTPSQLHMAAPKDKFILRDILDKALLSISEKEKREIVKTYTAVATDAAFAEPVLLTAEERAWIEEHPVVRVAPDPDFPPIEFFDEDGVYRGVAADLVRLAAERVGLELEILRKENWDAVLKSLENREADMAAALPEDEANRKYLSFTDAYDNFPSVIVTTKETQGEVTIDDLRGKPVAYVAGWPEGNWLRENYPDIEAVSVEDTLEGLNAVAFGRTAALVSFLPTAQHYILTEAMTNLRIAGRTPLTFPNQMAVRNDWPELLSIIQKGLDSITAEERTEIFRRWLGNEVEVDQQLALTRDERAWLASNRDVRLGVDPAWPPFEFIDENGVYSGVVSGYVEALSERTGLAMTPVPDLTWSEVLDKARAGEIDVVPGITPTPARAEFLNFTEPVVTFPIVIVTRKDAHYVSGIEGLLDSKIAVVRSYVTEELLRQDYPDLELHLQDSVADGLRALDAGEIDALVANLAAATFEIDRLGIDSLKIAAPTDYKHALSMGVRKDWPELVGILDKALVSLTDAERTAIKNAWVTVTYSFGLDTDKILVWAAPIGSAILIVIGMVLWWNRKLGAQIAVTKKAEAELAEAENKVRTALDNMPGAMFMLDKDLKFVVSNSQTAAMWGLPDDFIKPGLPVETVARRIAESGGYSENDIERAVESRLALIRDPDPEGSETTLPSGRHVVIRYSVTEDGGRVAVVSDITERKKAEAELAKAENQVRTALENMPGAMFMLDKDLKFVVFNAQTGGIWGLPDDFIKPGLPIETVVRSIAEQGGYPEKDVERAVESRMAQIRDPDPEGWETTLPSGRHVVIRYSVTEDGGRVAVVSDITERKKAEAEMQETKERLDLALEGSGDGLWDLNIKTKESYWDERWLRMLGYEGSSATINRTGDLVPSSDTFRSLLHPDDAARVIANIERALAADATSFTQEFRLKHKMGDWVWILSRGKVSERDEDGKPVRLIGTHTDITARKEAEVEIQETKERLAGAYDLITSSIQYASRIQRALLPSDGVLRDMCPEHFCIWEPRDVVGGDMYWVREDRHGYVVCLFDCTGHGVPGALMTTIAVSALSVAFAETGDPARLIARVNKAVKQALGQHEEDGPSDDGLEMGICLVEPERRRVTFAGARFELLSAVGDSIDVIKGDKHGVGYRRVPFESRFTNHSIRLKPGQRLYMYSDGIIDQIGGNRRRAFGRKRLTTLLRGLAHMPLPKQGAAITSALADYQGGEARRDDVSMIGFMPTP